MKKLIAFLYEGFAYAAFTAALLYAIGFVGNFIVPKSINAGTETTFENAFVVDALLLGVFAIQHRILTGLGFKKWVTRFINPATLRSTYILMASVAMLIVFRQWQPVTLVVWKIENQVTALMLNSVYFLGWLVVFASVLTALHFNLFGLKQFVEDLDKRHPQSSPFKANSIYTIIKQPIMLGVIIVSWSTPLMTFGHLLFSIIITSYIIITVKLLEEKELLQFYEKQYEEYEEKLLLIVTYTGAAKEISRPVNNTSSGSMRNVETNIKINVRHNKNSRSYPKPLPMGKQEPLLERW